MAFEDYESGEQLSEEDFKKRFSPKKAVKKIVAKATGKEEELAEPPEIEPDDDYTENKKMTSNQMQAAEEEVTQRQMMEYKEKALPSIESDAQITAKLFEIAARMAEKKELYDAVDTSGIIRKTALSLEEEYPEVFTEDVVKGNYEDIERACIFGHMTIINTMKMVGQAKSFSLVDVCRFNKMQMDAIINISRAKGGFSAILAKTDKHVSSGVVEHVQKAFKEKKEKRWGFM